MHLTEQLHKCNPGKMPEETCLDAERAVRTILDAEGAVRTKHVLIRIADGCGKAVRTNRIGRGKLNAPDAESTVRTNTVGRGTCRTHRSLRNLSPNYR